MTEVEIVDWILYNGNNIRHRDMGEAVEKIKRISNPSILKLLAVSPFLDLNLKEAAIGKINDATFLSRLKNNKIAMDYWSTSYISLCDNRLKQLPNTIKFITEE